VLISVEEENANGASVLFVVGGASPPSWNGELAQSFSRIVVLFDGRDEEALTSARKGWKDASDSGHDVTFWKQSAAGKWEEQPARTRDGSA
jgi:DNA polymerase-3 subunit chi